MKRYFSLFLSALLLLTLGTPALAAEAKTDQRLAQAEGQTRGGYTPDPPPASVPRQDIAKIWKNTKK